MLVILSLGSSTDGVRPAGASHQRLPSASSQAQRQEGVAQRCQSACACSEWCPKTGSCQESPADVDRFKSDYLPALTTIFNTFEVICNQMGMDAEQL